MSKVAFFTLGCKLNFSETSTVARQFAEGGFEIVDFNCAADVYVVNTCTVTENAEKECRQIVRRAQRLNPNAFIAVTGCYAQLRPEEISSIAGVDAVLGSHEKFKILSLFDDFTKKELSCVHVSPTEELNVFNSSFSSEALGRTRAFLKIQDGCDYKCTFCTIPLARGKSRSIEPDIAIAQFKNLLNTGYKEIILTGVNVGDYNYSEGKNIYYLLKKMISIKGDYRIRISSIEPNLLTDEIIDLAAGEEKICNHFHIPLQSGSSKILKLMQRRYNTGLYYNIINKAVNKVNELGIGVDVIVGFPGETEKDFLETYKFINELPVSYLHVFAYSERPETKAIEMTGMIPVAERKKRNNMLRILSEKKRQNFYRSMIGREVNVLFENESHNGYMHGWTSNYVRVKKHFNESLVNNFSHEMIDDVIDNMCIVEKNKHPLLNSIG